MAQDPYSAMGEGFKSGISLVSSIHQMKEQKRQQEWENDIKQFTMAADMLKSDRLGPEYKQELYNKTMKPKWDRWNPQTPLPDWNATMDDDVGGPYLKNMLGALEDMKSGKRDFSQTYQLLSANAAEWKNKAYKNEQESKRANEVSSSLLEGVKFSADQRNKELERKNKGGKDETEQKTKDLQRFTTISTTRANLKAKGTVTPEMVQDMPALAPFLGAKMTPETMATVDAAMLQEVNEMRTRNPGMKAVVTPAQVPALRESIIKNAAKQNIQLAPNQVDAIINQRAVVWQ